MQLLPALVWWGIHVLVKKQCVLFQAWPQAIRKALHDRPHGESCPPHTWLGTQTLRCTFWRDCSLDSGPQDWSCSYPTPNPDSSFLLYLSEAFADVFSKCLFMLEEKGEPWGTLFYITFTLSPPQHFALHESIKLPKVFIQSPLNHRWPPHLGWSTSPFTFNYSVGEDETGGGWESVLSQVLVCCYSKWLKAYLFQFWCIALIGHSDIAQFSLPVQLSCWHMIHFKRWQCCTWTLQGPFQSKCQFISLDHTWLECRGALTQPPGLPQMKKRLPRHDLLGEERWPFLSKEKGPEPLSPGAFIMFIRIGIQIKLINHC